MKKALKKFSYEEDNDEGRQELLKLVYSKDKSVISGDKLLRKVKGKMSGLDGFKTNGSFASLKPSVGAKTTPSLQKSASKLVKRAKDV